VTIVREEGRSLRNNPPGLLAPLIVSLGPRQRGRGGGNNGTNSIYNNCNSINDDNNNNKLPACNNNRLLERQGRARGDAGSAGSRCCSLSPRRRARPMTRRRLNELNGTGH
jgi:hypothetical protein